METDPNAKVYRLQWNDTGAPYVHPIRHCGEFKLDEAMRLAGFQALTVVDAETGNPVWIGSEATR